MVKWLNSDVFNLQRVRSVQQVDPLISVVYDWVEKAKHIDISELSPERQEIKYLLDQFPSPEISCGVLIRNKAGMAPKVQILIPRGL